ncbi:hypothetical protein BH18ACI3_BH18ACI3_10110 [soil metagenome]
MAAIYSTYTTKSYNYKGFFVEQPSDQKKLTLIHSAVNVR